MKTIQVPASEHILVRPAVSADGVVKTYGSGNNTVSTLRGVSAGLAAGQFTAIMGASGSGKSTFLHCLAGLDTVTAGRVWIGDADITGLSPARLTRLRRDRLGFVFQSYNLLPMLTAGENITLVARLAGRHVDRAWLGTLVGALGLKDRLRNRPGQLSGGQQQRVAVARALLTRPEVVFADEPTGNLDSKASAGVLGFLRSAVDTYHQTVVMVTHDPVAASYADRLLFLADGRIAGELDQPTTEAILSRMSREEG
jgi:putative ABC transport system ATP-binding protein